MFSLVSLAQERVIVHLKYTTNLAIPNRTCHMINESSQQRRILRPSYLGPQQPPHGELHFLAAHEYQQELVMMDQLLHDQLMNQLPHEMMDHSLYDDPYLSCEQM